MKRAMSCVLAATTALSLSTGVATARTSSDVTLPETIDYISKKATEEALLPGSGMTSSVKDDFSILDGNVDNFNPAETGVGILKLASSAKNDAAKGYKLGTTYEIILGTGITALVLGVLAAALKLSGAQLPF